MDIQEIKELIQALSASDIAEFIMEDTTGFRLTLRKGSTVQPAVVPVQAPATVQSAPAPAPAREAAPAAPAEQAEPSYDDPRYTTITAPMVGTFYRAPAPDAPPYVEVGDEIREGQALCIIEAMKLMNEIESEVSGRIVKILVENAQPVEYGQPLFIVERV